MLEEQRRAYTRMPVKIFRYKAKMIESTELHADDKLALVVIPHEEITEYSPLFNPNPLIQGEHLQTQGVLVSVSVKSYRNGRITAAIRCNHGAPVAKELAEYFGGGGHAYAAGFKLEGKPLDEVKQQIIQRTRELLA